MLLLRHLSEPIHVTLDLNLRLDRHGWMAYMTRHWLNLKGKQNFSMSIKGFDTLAVVKSDGIASYYWRICRSITSMVCLSRIMAEQLHGVLLLLAGI